MDLPLVDEHQVRIAAPAAAVWNALSAGLPSAGNTFAKAYATLVAAEPARATGTGGHRLAVPHMLRTIRRRAEAG